MMTTPPEAAFLRAEDFAALLDVSTWAVYEAVKKGEIRAVHVGRGVPDPKV